MRSGRTFLLRRVPSRTLSRAFHPNPSLSFCPVFPSPLTSQVALLQSLRHTHPNPTTSSPIGEAETAHSHGVSALDVAMRVNKLKRLHQTGGGPSGKKQMELDAWSELNSLTEEHINSAEGKEVSLLLNAWAYFAKYWEKGKDGPIVAGMGKAAASEGQEEGSEGRTTPSS